MKNGTTGNRTGKRAITVASGTTEDDDEAQAAALGRLQAALRRTLRGGGYSVSDPRRSNTDDHYAAGRIMVSGVGDAINREVLAMDYVHLALKAGRIWDAEDLCRMRIFVHHHALFWVVYETAQAIKAAAMKAGAPQYASTAPYLNARIRWYVVVLRQIAQRVTDENSAPGGRAECFTAIHQLTGTDEDELRKAQEMLHFIHRHPQSAAVPEDTQAATA